MADVKPLTRNQIASFAGNDPEVIRAIERLFAVAGQSIPDEVATLIIQVAQLFVITTDQSYDLNAVNDLALGANTNTPAIDYIDLNVAPRSGKARRIGWNNTDQTVDIGMAYNVTQQVGQEVYARVGNTTGVTIPNGTLVGFAGATPDALLVAPYLANGSSPSLYVLGIMTHDLPDSGQKGYCTTWGFVRTLNTSAFSAGQVLYASPTVPGGLTNVKPTAPNNVIPMAACIVSHATDGVIFVRPTIQQQQYYAVVSKTTDQSPVAINTEYQLTFDSVQIGNGITIGSPASRIVVPQSGLYQLEARVQITSSSSSAKNVWVWFKKNGVTIPNSARIVTTDINSGYIPIALTQTVSLDASDYIEMAFASDDTTVTIDTVAATAFAPAAPAVILAITQSQQ